MERDVYKRQVNSINDPIIGLNTEREVLFINDEALSILNMKRENVIRRCV